MRSGSATQSILLPSYAFDFTTLCCQVNMDIIYIVALGLSRTDKSSRSHKYAPGFSPREDVGTLAEDFTLPHIFRLDSRWTPADSRWISAVHPPFFQIFSLVGTQPNFSPESIWTPAGLQAHHLDCMDSISLHS